MKPQVAIGGVGLVCLKNVCVCVCVCVCVYVCVCVHCSNDSDISDILIDLISSENLKCPMNHVLQVTALGGLSAS